MTAARAPRVHWRPPKRGVWWPIWAFGWGLLRLTMPWLVGYRVFGREHVPARGGVLVVSNHLADIDPVYFEQPYYLIPDKDAAKPYRLHIRGPSFVNLQSLPVMLRGGLIADAVAVISSADPVMGEVDR